MKKNYLSTIYPFFLFLFFFIYSSSSTAQMWEQLGSPPFLTDHTYGFGIDGKAYVIQGNSGNPLWEYTPATDTWTEIGDFPGPSRGFPVGDEWNGLYYYGFGTQGGTAMNDLWVFDPADQSFTELPSCPCTPRYHPAFIAHNDKIMMGTGSSGTGNLEDWWEYDMITQVWTQKQNIPGGARHHPFFFSSGNSVFLGGGHRDTWFEYNLDTEVLTPIDNTPLGRVAGTQFNYDGKGFLLAGDDASHNHVADSETFMFYDPQVQEWGYLPPLPEGSRWACSSFIIDEILYYFDGVDYDNGSNSSVWKFDLSKLDCLPPSNLSVNNLDETVADLSWITYSSAPTTLRWKKASDPDWIEVSNAQPVFSLENLEPCEEYEYQLVSTCSSDMTFSEVFSFQTKGCGSCIDLEYCESQQFFNNNDAFISKVEINSFVNTSGESSEGYENFTVPDPEEVMIGEDFTLTVEVSETNGGSKLKVWIDLDQDGNFENSEIVADESIPDDELTTNVAVPNSALLGVTRIRISYGYSGNPNANIDLPACNTSSQLIDGEAEDYCILLVESTSTDQFKNAIKLKAYPNPFQETVRLEGNLPFNKNYQLEVLNIMGETINTIDNFSISDEINLSNVPSGVYFLRIEDEGVYYQARLVKQD